ncbi:MAG TPA: AAA family ATPase [Bacillota bacterium]|nr:AAA family ATPase [Bacillota bacterium]
MNQTIYLISGPAGVGKTTTSKQLVKSLARSAYVSGDVISYFPVNGRGKPWLCPDTLSLTWENILAVTRNLLRHNYDVVVDYVTFPKQLHWFVNELSDFDVRIVYVVLLVDPETLVYRDQLRPPDCRMAERSLVLLQEFREAGLDPKHIIDTGKYSVEQLDAIIAEIKTNSKYIVSS